MQIKSINASPGLGMASTQAMTNNYIGSGKLVNHSDFLFSKTGLASPNANGMYQSKAKNNDFLVQGNTHFRNKT